MVSKAFVEGWIEHWKSLGASDEGIRMLCIASGFPEEYFLWL